MAITVSTDGFSQELGAVTFYGSWDNGCGAARVIFGFGYGSIDQFTSTQSSSAGAGSYSDGAGSLSHDVTFRFRAEGNDLNCPGNATGATQVLKTFADAPTIGVPAPTTQTNNSISGNETWNPNTNESTAELRIQYRVSGSGSAWSEVSVVSGVGTYGQRIDAWSITGLTAGTLYEIRARIIRNTSNDGDLYGTSTTRSTNSAVTAVTNAASAVGSTSATLNGTINPAGATGGNPVSYYFQYGLTAAYGTNTTPTGSLTGSTDQAVSQSISGLAASTTYHFRVVAKQGGVDAAFGSDLTFATSASASAQGEDEDVILEYFGKYGVQTDFYFPIKEVAGTSNDRFRSTSPTFAAADTKLTKDGGVPANTTNVPVQVNGNFYKLTLTATEMQASRIMVAIVDSDGPVWRDLALIINTALGLGSIDVANPNGTAILAVSSGSNGSGIAATGNGSGSGFLGTAGGTGQICNFFDTPEGTEPTTAIGNNATMRQILQYVKRRFFNKRTQTSGTQTMYRDDSTTILQSCTSADDGTTQTLGKYS